MSTKALITLPDLVIASGESHSNELDRTHLEQLDTLVIRGPSSLAGTVTVEVATVPNPADADFSELKDVRGNIVTIAADEATVIEHIGYFALRLAEAVAPSSDETFTVSARDS